MLFPVVYVGVTFINFIYNIKMKTSIHKIES